MLKQLGRCLKQYRKLAGLTQEALAERAGIDTKYYGEIERGEKAPSIIVVLKIANALEVDPGLLLRSIESNGVQRYELITIEKVLNKRDPKTLSKIAEVLNIIFNQS